MIHPFNSLPFSDTISVENSFYHELSAFSLIRPRHFVLSNVSGPHSLSGLNTNVTMSLSLQNCSELTSIGIPLKVSALEIVDCQLLTDITGFSVTDRFVQSVVLSGAHSLATLDGLQNITSIRGNLILRNNESLNDISALQFQQPNLLDSLEIRDNPQLELCHVPSVCAYLELLQPFQISGNALGCENELQVLDSCGIISMNLNAVIENVRVFPVPAKDKVIIEASYQIDHVVVLGSNGELVLRQEGNQIDTSSLPSGLYILQVVTGNQIEFIKLIVTH